ncbi:PAS domain-containing sensor histidine kinase [Hoeflea sp. AS60]|uniref:sensor histidine kinase n=1 Tax=Hoeflea sp. AS60 TaxID=3135780 RepID=UPI00317322B7
MNRELYKGPAAQGIGLVCVTIGMIVIAIWLLRLEQIAESFPIVLAMQFNTALCLVLLGTAFIAAAYGYTRVVYTLTIATALMAVVSLYQYVSGINVGIDTLFNTPFVTVGASSPGRMAPNSAICFLLAAIGISIPRIHFASQARLALGFVVAGIAAIALLGYGVRLDRAHDWFGPARMSPHTGFGFLVIGSGLIYLGVERSGNHVRLVASAIAVVAYLAVLLLTHLEFLAQELHHREQLGADHSVETLQTLSTLVLVSGILYLGLTGYAFWYSQRYRRSAAALAASEARLAAVIDTAVDGIVTIDRNGTILTVNRACEDMFGYRREEMIGENVKMMMPKRYSDEHDGYLDSYHRTGQAKIIGIGRELEGRRSDGSVFPVELAVARISLADRVIYSGIVRDITVRKRFEAEILEANAELEEFAYRTSHDLRSPVASSLGLVHIAKDLLQNGEHGVLVTTLDRLERNFKRLDGLIQNIIAVTRTRLMVEEVAPISVRAVVDETLDELSHLDGFSDMAIDVDIDPELQIISKPIKFQMIIANLLSNAIKYKDADEPKPVLVISASRQNRLVHIAFADNGLGIPPDARPMLFEMFKRFHPEKAFGSGLGLYILRKSTEALGGNVTFEPQQKGSRFVVELPDGDANADADSIDRR